MSVARCDGLFDAMVESVGVKAFAMNLNLSTRQVHRMLNGTQANPLSRLWQAMGACEPVSGEEALDFLCQEQGGYFVRLPKDMDSANLNAVKESAEAIVAISEGQSPRVTVKELRDAISALAALERQLQSQN